ncbi:hypothetical protein D3C71_2102950 [compost metagenome]
MAGKYWAGIHRHDVTGNGAWADCTDFRGDPSGAAPRGADGYPAPWPALTTSLAAGYHPT